MVDAQYFNASRLFFPLDNKDSASSNWHQSITYIVPLIITWIVRKMDLVSICLICRVAALLLLLPFALCIGLDIIAYAIARTLRLSVLQTRVPGSPTEASPAPGTAYTITAPGGDHSLQDGQGTNSLELAIDKAGHKVIKSVRDVFSPPLNCETSQHPDALDTAIRGVGDESSATDLNFDSQDELRRRLIPQPTLSPTSAK